MTTRRVILLVLVMLFMVPMFRADGLFGPPVYTSAQYGLNCVSDSFRRYLFSKKEYDETPTPAKAERLKAERWTYERNHLFLVYYHNWHASDDPQGGASFHPKSRLNTVWWLGFLEDPATSTENKALADAARVGRSELGGYVPSTVWDNIHSEKWMGQYSAGKMPAVNQDVLKGDFSIACFKKWGRAFGNPQDVTCPRDLRYYEIERITPMTVVPTLDKVTVPALEKMIFVLYADALASSHLGALLNVFQTLFVIFVLAGGSSMFAKDANRLVLKPVERIIGKLSIIRKNPFEAIKVGCC